MSTRPVNIESSSPSQSAIPETRPHQPKMKLRRAAQCFGAILLFVLVAWILLLAFPKKHQHISITHDFGIGFDLSPSYATVAVSYPNGTIRSIARIEGDEVYWEMMLRLSHDSSKHLHQPYQDVGEAIRDSTRRTVRNTRKRLGLPSSQDVGTLSNMISALRDQASSFVGEPISAAAISIPHLAALYGEDLRDAFEYLSLGYLEFFPYSNFRPIPAVVAAYAGNGLGLCVDYRNVITCNEEELHIPSLFALTVGYTHASIMTSQAHLSNAYYIEETPTRENLLLGYDERCSLDSYWEAVRMMLEWPLRVSPVPMNISMVLLYGDTVDKLEFREVLQQAIHEFIDGKPEIVVGQEAEFSAARGTAELAKRAIFRQTRELNAQIEL